MICLLDTKEIPDVGFVSRFSRFRRGYTGISFKNLTIMGVRALHITIDKAPAISQRTVQKRIKLVTDRIREEHISRVLFSINFPYRELVLREGFGEIDESLLMETLAGEIASKFAGKEKVAAFFADRMTAGVEKTFCDLCRDFRYVMAVLESDGSRLFSSLGKRLGLSVIGQPSEKQLLKVDVAVFFSAPLVTTVLPETCIVIPARHNALDRVVARKAVANLSIGLRDGMEPDIPEGFPRDPLFAVALDAGTLRREEILLREFKMTDMYV